MNRQSRFLSLAFALLFTPIYFAYSAPNSFTCKPLPFYRFRVDQRQRYQLNRLAAAGPLGVRLIYFIPSDRLFRAEVPAQMEALIKQTQAFYANQMQAHGYGPKTFAFETNTAGQSVVLRVNGRFPDSQYLGGNTSRNVEAELDAQFSLTDNIYLVAVDVSDGRINGAGGVGGSRGPNGGVAFVPASGISFNFRTVAHELGHAFGLQHDFRDDTNIMSYGDNPDRLSACSAEFLDVNRYFNPNRNFTSAAEPTIRITSSLEYPDGASSITLRFELSDPDGLHQAQLLPITTDFANGVNRAAAVGSPEIQACTKLNGQTQIVTFSYAKLSGADAHRVALGVVDLQGHAALKEFSVFSTGRPGQTLRVAQTGGADFPSISAALERAMPRDQIEITDSAIYNERVQITGNLLSIRPASGAQPSIETVVSFGATDITLKGVNILDGVFVQDGSVMTLQNNAIESSQSGVLIAGSIAQIEQNQIRNAQNGVVVQDGSEAIIKGNQITDHRDSAIVVLGSKATITANEIHRSLNHGLVISGGIEQALLKDNTIEESGALGVLLIKSDVRAEGNTLRKNRDGGIAAQDGSQLVLTGNTIVENQSTGVRIADSTAEITQNTISRNDDGNASGEFDWAIQISNATGTVTIRDNIMVRNGAGVVALTSPQVVLINNLISRSRNTNGHGVVLQGSSGRLINNTIAFHELGVLVFTQVTTPQVTVVNTLFAGNRSDVANFNQATADSQISHSLLADASWTGRNRNIGGDARFVDANNDDFHLQPGSPAIDAGDTSVVAPPQFDLDGKLRIAGASVDIGAYEFGSETPLPAFHEFLLEFPAGISLRHLPLAITHINEQPQSIQRVSDLYDLLGGDANVYQLITYNNQTGKFQSFSLFEVTHATSLNTLPANLSLEPHAGVIAIMKRSVTLKLRGDALIGVVPLSAGLNLVGVPLRDANLSRISALAQTTELRGNVKRILSYDGNKFISFTPGVDSPGGAGDVPIDGGQAYLIEVNRPTTLQVSGNGWDNVR